jgi:hypothetical protein
MQKARAVRRIHTGFLSRRAVIGRDDPKLGKRFMRISCPAGCQANGVGPFTKGNNTRRDSADRARHKKRFGSARAACPANGDERAGYKASVQMKCVFPEVFCNVRTDNQAAIRSRNRMNKSGFSFFADSCFKASARYLLVASTAACIDQSPRPGPLPPSNSMDVLPA